MREAQIWYTRAPDQRVLSAEFENVIVLSDEFYQELVAHPVPNDLAAVKLLAASPAVLDLYMWLSYRASGRRALKRFRCSANSDLPIRSARSNTPGHAGSGE